jgi:hypothetical protein
MRYPYFVERKVRAQNVKRNYKPATKAMRAGERLASRRVIALSHARGKLVWFKKAHSFKAWVTRVFLMLLLVHSGGGSLTSGRG